MIAAPTAAVKPRVFRLAMSLDGATTGSPPVGPFGRFVDDAPLQALAALDVDRDGLVGRADAEILASWEQQLADAPRAGTPGALPAAAPPAPSPTRLARLTLRVDGTVDASALTPGDRAAAATDLRWAAEQARLGAALVLASGTGTLNGAAPLTLPRGELGPRDAAAAIRKLSTAGFAQHGARPVAVFDYDGTSARGDVFVPAMRAMAHHGLFQEAAQEPLRAALARTSADPPTIAHNDANANAALLAGLITPEGTASTVSIKDGFFAFADALAGVDVARATSAVRAAVADGVPELGIPPLRGEVNDDSPGPGDSVVDVVAALQHSGIEPWIVTYGFEFIARELAPTLGIDPAHVTGSRAPSRDGAFVGGVESTRPKWQMVRDDVGGVPLLAFGDSASDLSMIDQAVAHGFIVNPVTDGMREAVSERPGRVSALRYGGTSVQVPAPASRGASDSAAG